MVVGISIIILMLSYFVFSFAYAHKDRQLKEAIQLLDGALHYHSTATYDNGVEFGGRNEGDVKAREFYSQVHEFLREIEKKTPTV